MLVATSLALMDDELITRSPPVSVTDTFDPARILRRVEDESRASPEPELLFKTSCLVLSLVTFRSTSFASEDRLACPVARRRLMTLAVVLNISVPTPPPDASVACLPPRLVATLVWWDAKVAALTPDTSKVTRELLSVIVAFPVTSRRLMSLFLSRVTPAALGTVSVACLALMKARSVLYTSWSS